MGGLIAIFLVFQVAVFGFLFSLVVGAGAIIKGITRFIKSLRGDEF